MAHAAFSEQITGASLVPSNGPLYRLNDLGLGLAARQTYALNLVWALEEQEEIGENDNVAVVGAGAAGMTAAIGLSRLGCQVEIFDTASKILPQRETSHRFLHPTLNFWPSEPTNPATDLPFFNWYADASDVVEQTLLRQSEQLLREVSLHLNWKVRSIDEDKTGLRLSIETPTSKTEATSYKAVLLASDRPSYWDAVDTIDEQIGRGFREFVIADAHGGSMVDTLRIVYRNFARGRLAFELANLLAPTPIAQQIQGMEEQARSQPDAQRQAIAYRTIASNLPPDITAVLNAALDPSMRVHMSVESFAQFYSQRSAPIHKLLLAFAETHGLIDYLPGTLHIEGTEILVGAAKFSTAQTSLIVRHGRQSALDRLIPGGPRPPALKVAKEQLARRHWGSSFHRRMETPFRRRQNIAPVHQPDGIQIAESVDHGGDEIEVATRILAEGKPAPISVLFATDRERDGETFGRVYGASLSYGRATVTIPPSTHEIGRVETPLALGPLKQRYDPQKHVTLSGITICSHSEMMQALAAEMGAPRALLLFVHGFNVSFDQALRRTAQLKFDLRFRGAACLYSWTSRGAPFPLDYNRDREYSMITTRHLREFIETTILPSKPEKVFVIAHSMGNQALLTVLDQLSLNVPVFTEILLVAPDVNKKLFRQLASAFARNGKRTTLYGSKWDYALWASRLYAGDEERAGDASPPVIVPGVDSIDVSAMSITHDPINHFCLDDDRVLGDIKEIVDGNESAAQRLRLVPAQSSEGRYWRMVRK